MRVCGLQGFTAKGLMMVDVAGASYVVLFEVVCGDLLPKKPIDPELQATTKKCIGALG